MRTLRMRFILLPLILGLGCAIAMAQANSTVTGIVTDPTGALVSGATIQLTDSATGITRTAVSDASGLYTIAGLNAATYDMKVTATGFATFVKKGVVVNISATFRNDVQLAVGTETQTVTIAANALTVQADSNVVSNLISEQQIAELPTNGRNVIALATMGMGVSGNLPSAENPFSVNANYAISFNGLNQAHNVWIVDGAEQYDRGSGGKMSIMPSQDALQEFQVLSSNFEPDYGYGSGAAITMALKSGTSKFHGGAWEFVRNDALDARDFFNKNPQPVQELRYNVFGANLGGPFFIPGHYNSARKNKTFFFYNEEWRKMVNGAPPAPIQTLPAADIVSSKAAFTYQVPAYAPAAQFCTAPVYSGGSVTCPSGAAYPNGVIWVPTVSPNSRVGQAILADDLVMGQPFPNNVIPANLLDDNALLFNTLHNLPPATNPANDTYTPTGGHLPINVREELFRVDHNINDKWSIFGHFVHDANVSVQPTPQWQADNIPTVGSNFSNPSYSSVIKLTGQLSPNVLLETAFGYNGNKIAIIPVAEAGGSFVKPPGWSTGMYFPAANDVGNRLPNLHWSSIGDTWGPGNDPWTNGAEDYNENFNLAVTYGKHNLKFGGGYNRYTKNQVIGKNSEGDYYFDDQWLGPTAANTTQNRPAYGLTGDSYLDFLLGLPDGHNLESQGNVAFSEASANPINHYVTNTISMYAMDNWHLTSRLTVQLGLRYDAMPHVWERNNQVSNFVPSLYQSGLAPTFNSDGSFAANSPGMQTFNFDGVPTPFYMNGIAIAGQLGTPRALVKNDYNTIMPRLGFSYDLLGDGKTILRAGFGTFFERVQGNDIYNAAGAPPFISQPGANQVEFSNPLANWATGQAAATPSFPQGYNAMNTHYPDPGVAEYSLGIQREILPALVLTTQYVGNVAWAQNTWIPINNFPLSTPMSVRQLYAAPTATQTKLTSAQVNSLDTYAGFGPINLQSDAVTGTYNSLQAGLRQEHKWGLSYGAYYTWAHQIDATQTSVDVDNNNPAFNPWNLKYDKGSGSLDRRHVFNINYEYKVPFFAHSSGLVHSLAGGWEIAGNIISETGLPWYGGVAPKTPYGDTVGLGGNYSIRPDLTGPVHYIKGFTAKGYQLLDSTNFAQPVAAWNGGPNMGFGNSGKDAVVGNGNTNFNTAVYKTFAFGERASFEFRAESFNTFNHPQFTGMQSTNPTNKNFGVASTDQISNAINPRVFELGAKIKF